MDFMGRSFKKKIVQSDLNFLRSSTNTLVFHSLPRTNNDKNIKLQTSLKSHSQLSILKIKTL